MFPYPGKWRVDQRRPEEEPMEELKEEDINEEEDE